MKLLELNPSPFPKEQLFRKLEEQKILINRYAEEFFSHPDFSTEQVSDTVIMIASLKEIGLENGGSLDEIFAQAEKVFLKPCPVNTGLFLRLAWKDQPQSQNSVLSGTHQAPDSSVTVLSAVMERDDAFPKGLYLRNVSGSLWLRGYVCGSSYRFCADDVFAFEKV